MEPIIAAEALATYEAKNPERDAEREKEHRKFVGKLSDECWKVIRSGMADCTLCRINIGRKSEYFGHHSAVKEVIWILKERGFTVETVRGGECLRVSWHKEFHGIRRSCEGRTR